MTVHRSGRVQAAGSHDVETGNPYLEGAVGVAAVVLTPDTFSHVTPQLDLAAAERICALVNDDQSPL